MLNIWVDGCLHFALSCRVALSRRFISVVIEVDGTERDEVWAMNAERLTNGQSTPDSVASASSRVSSLGSGTAATGPKPVLTVVDQFLGEQVRGCSSAWPLFKCSFLTSRGTSHPDQCGRRARGSGKEPAATRQLFKEMAYSRSCLSGRWAVVAAARATWVSMLCAART